MKLVGVFVGADNVQTALQFGQGLGVFHSLTTYQVVVSRCCRTGVQLHKQGVDV